MSFRLLIRADASPEMGTGHVMRCLSLAQGLQDSKGVAIFASADMPPYLMSFLRAEGVEVCKLESLAGSSDDALEVAEIAKKQLADCVVVDGYSFGDSYLSILKDSDLRVLLVEDAPGSECAPVDFVLNQNFYADELSYNHFGPETDLLIGPQFILLRREFRKWQHWTRTISTVPRKMIVTIGGSDPHDVTSLVMRGLNDLNISGAEATIVVGGSNSRLAELENVVTDSEVSMKIVVDVRNMSDLMSWADLIVTGGGSTTWEAAYMGLSGLVIPVAVTQVENAEKVDGLGILTNIGWYQNVSPKSISEALRSIVEDSDRRRKNAQIGRALVDGNGVFRVLERIANRIT